MRAVTSKSPVKMAVSGDWVTPRLNGLKYEKKPPIANIGLQRRPMGVWPLNEWTARLWTGLTGFAGILLAAFAAYRLYGRARNGSVDWRGSWWLFYQRHWGTSTRWTWVSHFSRLALVGFCSLIAIKPARQKNRNWMMITWAAMAGAMLSKGLIGLVLPGAALVLYVLITRQWRLLVKHAFGNRGCCCLVFTAPVVCAGIAAQSGVRSSSSFTSISVWIDVACRVEPW